MSFTNPLGRLGNQIVRNIAVSMVAKRFNLFVDYSSYFIIKNIGIDLFIGENTYDTTVDLTDNNYFEILSNSEFKYNINPNNNYFQTKKITNIIHSYLNTDSVMNNIILNNKYTNRYNNNNDCFIHIRLGDVSEWNPGFEYYDSIISTLMIDNIFISTDSPEHIIIKKIQEKYPNTTVFDESLDNIIMFGSTNKYVILSYGTFSAIIGYLSFYSIVYYKTVSEKTAWDWNKPDECDMFNNKKTKIGNWIEL